MLAHDPPVVPKAGGIATSDTRTPRRPAGANPRAPPPRSAGSTRRRGATEYRRQAYARLPPSVLHRRDGPPSPKRVHRCHRRVKGREDGTKTCHHRFLRRALPSTCRRERSSLHNHGEARRRRLRPVRPRVGETGRTRERTGNADFMTNGSGRDAGGRREFRVGDDLMKYRETDGKRFSGPPTSRSVKTRRWSPRGATAGDGRDRERRQMSVRPHGDVRQVGFPVDGIPSRGHRVTVVAGLPEAPPPLPGPDAGASGAFTFPYRGTSRRPMAGKSGGVDRSARSAPARTFPPEASARPVLRPRSGVPRKERRRKWGAPGAGGPLPLAVSGRPSNMPAWNVPALAEAPETADRRKNALTGISGRKRSYLHSGPWYP